MIETVKNFLMNIFTGRDNQTFSASKAVGVVGGFAMIGQFLHAGSVDFQGFAIGLGTIIAALAVKYHVEKPSEGEDK